MNYRRRHLVPVKCLQGLLHILFLILAIFLHGTATAALELNAQPVGVAAALPQASTVTFFVNTQEYDFTNPALDPPPAFKIKVTEPRVMMGLVSVQSFLNTLRCIPVYQGGFWVQNATGQVFSPLQIAGLGECKLTRNEIIGNRLVLEYEEPVFGAVLKKRFEYQVQGRTMKITMTDRSGPQEQARYMGFSFGPTRYIGRPKFLNFPTSPVPALQSMGRIYLSLYVDPFLSNLNRFTYSARRETSRSYFCSNTPAWVELSEGETPEPLKVVAYVTLSEDPLDIEPTRPTEITPDSKDLRKRVAFDLSETPFIPMGRGYVTQVRRWSAPTSGPLELNGTVKLSSSDRALFEVILERPGEPSRLLFSQMLDAHSKPATGLKGTFPIQENDQLLFACQSPAVMQGGTVDLRIQMQQGSAHYDSMADFASVQGHNGWYYEQKHKLGSSLLLWNPTDQVWESPDSRSQQSALTMAVRSGPKGDAFPIAAQFLARLNDAGVPNPMYILRDWDQYMADVIRADEKGPGKWGSTGMLNSIDAALTASQIRVEHQWPLETIDDLAMLNQLAITDVNEGADLAAFLVSDVEEDPEATPAPQIKNISPTAETPSAAPSKPVMKAPVPTPFPIRPATAEVVPPADMRLTRALYRFAANQENAALSPSDTPFLIDDALRNQRPAKAIVGLGGYAKFLGDDDAFAWQDERFFPFDEYLTSMVAFGRVPHISDRLWKPGAGPGDVWRLMVEAASLLQPVMAEALDPLNAVVRIHYVSNKDEFLELQQLLYLRDSEQVNQYNRLKIEYANGLVIYANRGDSPWAVSETGIGIDAIAPGGFLARNERTGIASFIGRRGEREFSVNASANGYFINSRDGGLLRVGEWATDGLSKLTHNASSDHWDAVLSDAHEVSRSDTLLPIVRANHRIDAVMRWTSASSMTLHLYEAESNVCMLELYDLPQDKLDGAHAQIQRNVNEVIDVPIDVVTSAGKKGLRIVDITPGDLLTISFSE
ncbi:alanine and proline-rich secreted protein Apa [bacterium]|nr:alanine and proline-rich secreted protein Apa [bacterium]